MKKIISSLRDMILSKIGIKVLFLIILVALVVWSFLKLNWIFKQHDEPVQTQIVLDTPEKTIKELSSLMDTSVDKMLNGSLYKLDKTFFIDRKKKQLIFNSSESKTTTFSYKTPIFTGFRLDPESESAFDDLLKNELDVKIYDDLKEKDTPPQKPEVLSLLDTLFEQKYTELPRAFAGRDIRSIVFLTLLSEIASLDKDHVALVIENKKITRKNKKDLNIDLINLPLLSDGITDIKKIIADESSQFINNKYAHLHPDKASKKTTSPSLQADLDKLFGKDAIRLNGAGQLAFVSLNQSKNILYLNSTALAYDLVTLYPTNKELAESVLKTNFSQSISTYASDILDDNQVVTLANALNIPLDSIVISHNEREKILPFQAVFKLIINQATIHPGVYIINDDKLYNLNFGQNESFQLVNFNKPAIAQGVKNLQATLSKLPPMNIVKEDPLARVVIFLTLILLVLLIVALIFSPGLLSFKKATETIEIETAGSDPVEPNQPVKEKIAAPKNSTIEKAAVVKIMNFLINRGKEPKYEIEVFTQVKEKVDFYNELFKAEKVTDVLDLLEKEGESKHSFPDLKMAKKGHDILNAAKNETSADEKITAMLKQHDFLSNARQLSSRYEQLKEAETDRKKIAKLLKNPSTNISDFLKEKIKKMEENQEVNNLIDFTYNFHSSPDVKRIKPGQVVDDYVESRKCITEFLQSCQQLNAQKFMDRAAIMLWSMKLATDICEIHKVRLPNVDLDKVKSEQLKLFFTNYFLHVATNTILTEADFNMNVEAGRLTIEDHNSKFARDNVVKFDIKAVDQVIGELGILTKKIKKYEKTEVVFKKLYDHFIKQFKERIGKLRFSEEDLNPEDRAWLFQQLFNITFHAADYVEYFIKQDPEYYYHNFQFLLKDLNLKDGEYKEFEENHMERSTYASNAVKKAARFAGVTKLDIIVDEFYIKP